MGVQDDGLNRFSRYDAQTYRSQGSSPIAPPGGLTVPASPTLSSSSSSPSSDHFPSRHSPGRSPPPIINSVLAGEIATKYMLSPPSSPGIPPLTPVSVVRSCNFPVAEAKEVKVIRIRTGSDANSKEVTALQIKFDEITQMRKRVEALRVICESFVQSELDEAQEESLKRAKEQIKDIQIDSPAQAKSLYHKAQNDLRVAERRARNITGLILPDGDVNPVLAATDNLARVMWNTAHILDENTQEIARKQALGDLDAKLKSIQPQADVAGKTKQESSCCVIM